MKKLLLIALCIVIGSSLFAQKNKREVEIDPGYYMSVATVTVTEVSSFGQGYCILKLENGSVERDIKVPFEKWVKLGSEFVLDPMVKLKKKMKWDNFTAKKDFTEKYKL